MQIVLDRNTEKVVGSRLLESEALSVSVRRKAGARRLTLF